MIKIKNCIYGICLIIIFLLFFSFNITAHANAEQWLYDESGYVVCIYRIEDNEITITSCGNMNDVIIPSEIEGFPVTKLAHHSAAFNKYHISIKLPQTLVTIEDEAIISCKNIKEITIPKSVQNIGEHALGYILTDCSDPEYMPYLKYLPYKFRIKGYKGTAAETYANENGFKFVYLDDEPQVTTATTITTQTTTTSTTVSTTTTSKATTETTKATTSATTITTNSTTTISTSASTTASSTSISTTTSATSTSKDTTTNLTTPLTTTSTSETTPITTTHVKGDANGDNKLDVRDAACIAKKLALDKAKELPKWADFNEDGTVNVRDAAEIARFLSSRKR